MHLYLCEKQLQAEDVANALGVFSKGNGFYRVGNDMFVTWAKGHLLEMYQPEDYDAKFKRWDLTDLPIKPSRWKKRVKVAGKDQFLKVQNLLSLATVVFIATDLDREGESIARELLEICNFKGTVKRIRITALDQESLKSALSDARNIEETTLLADAAEARQKADWLVGMNLTRLYSLMAQKMGIPDTFHVGRVAVPTIALVCQRDEQIREYRKTPYYTLKIECTFNECSFEAKWVPPKACCDKKKRCIDQQARNSVANSLSKDNAGFVTVLEAKIQKNNAPLPFDLNALQQIACNRWGYTSKEVLTGLQSLYEKHKAITYPRTENRYLPSRFMRLVPDILEAIRNSGKIGEQITSGVIVGNITGARVFDDEHVDAAHHAIIPTRSPVKMEHMNKIEGRLYHLICRYFVAQFYPDHVVEKTSVGIHINGSTFKAPASCVRVIGWKSVLGKNLTLIEESAEMDIESGPPLPRFSYGDTVNVSRSIPEDHMTVPPEHFTEAALIAAMKRIGRFIDDENLRKTLDDTAGLGTAATRAEIIETAIQRGYLQRETHKKRITSTPKGNDLIAILPRQISSPGTTALWEMRLEQVASGQIGGEFFSLEIGEWVEKIVESTKKNMEEHDHYMVSQAAL